MKRRGCRAAAGLALAAILLFFLIQAILLPRWEARTLAQAYRREVYAVQSLAGALMSAHPTLKDDILRALKQGDQQQALGEDVLSSYGYGGQLLEEQPAYRGLLAEGQRRAGLFALTSLALCGAVGAYWAWVNRRQARRARSIAGDYLSGDFSFAHSPEALGRPGGAQGRLGDTLKQLGGQIELQSQRLYQEKESTKALVTDISHQLKTPLSALNTCFSLYLEAASPDERAEFASRCQLQLRKLEALTGTLVNISRLEQAMITLDARPMDLEELLISAVNGVYDKARRKEISLELEPFPPLTLSLDGKWTSEAVMNVLDNAVKYSPPGSLVRIRVQRLVTFVRIEIQDQGPGIPKDQINRIFQRFYRGDSPAVRAEEGAGVGLYLTRFILEQQGGSIAVRSEVGTGSTFVLQLRLSAVSQP